MQFLNLIRSCLYFNTCLLSILSTGLFQEDGSAKFDVQTVSKSESLCNSKEQQKPMPVVQATEMFANGDVQEW